MKPNTEKHHLRHASNSISDIKLTKSSTHYKEYDNQTESSYGTQV